MKLGEMLVRANLIDEIQLKVALKEQISSREKLGSTLVSLGFMDENVLSAFLSKQMDIPCISVGNLNPPPHIVALVPGEIAIKYTVLPVRKSGDRLYLAMTDPTDYHAMDSVEKVTGLKIDPLVAAESSIKRAHRRLYDSDREAGDEAKLMFLHDSTVFPGLTQEVELNSFIIESYSRMEKDLLELRDSVESLKRLIIRFISQKEE